VESAIKGKLSDKDFPFSSPGYSTLDRFNQIIVFIVGGVTYEEAKEIATEFNLQRNNVIIGGTHIHNSKTFLADVANISASRFGNMQHFEIE